MSVRKGIDVWTEVHGLTEILFTEEVLGRCASEHERLAKLNILDDTRTAFEAATVKAATTLSSIPLIEESKKFIDSLSPAIQVFLFERFYFFEQSLREIGHREAEFPEHFGSLLRQGLIDSFDLRRRSGILF